MLTTINRIPRSKGLTQTAIQSLQNNDNTLHYAIAKHYIHNGFTYYQQPISIQELAHLTQLDYNTLFSSIIQVNKESAQLINFSDLQDNLKESLSTSFQMIFSVLLSDKALSERQVRILAQSQNGEYKAFISSTLNQAIKNTLAASSNMSKILESAIGKLGMAAFKPSDNPTDKGEGLTVSKAMELLNNIEPKPNSLPSTEAPKQLGSHETFASIYTEYNLEDTPEVKATGADIEMGTPKRKRHSSKSEVIPI